MAYYLSPVYQDAQLATSTGAPLVGGKLYAYLAGSTTPATVYQDDAGSSSHTNPIILDARGEPPAPIWISGGQSIKFQLNDANDVPIRTIDDVFGVNDPSSIVIDAPTEWVTLSTAPTYVSSSSFTVTGNQTADLHVGRRVKIPVSGNTSYGTITSSTFGALTTITIDTGGSVGLDASINSLSAIYMALLRADGISLPFYDVKDQTIKMATASGTGAYTVTTTYGTTLSAGQRMRVLFSSASTTAAATLDRDSTGAKALKRYATDGTKLDAVITAAMLADVEYDGTDYIVLTPLDIPKGKQRFTSGGTWTAPFGVTTVWLSGCGPGGGGGGNNAAVGGGGGGGGQSVVAEAVTVVPGTAYTVTIGSGGTGGATTVAGSAGTSATSFGALLTLAAGAGGAAGGNGGAAGGAGGSAGGTGSGQSGVDNAGGGIGGGTHWGAGGAGGTFNNVTGRAGSGYGSGGGGGGQQGGTGGAGGAGSNGFLLVEW